MTPSRTTADSRLDLSISMSHNLKVHRDTDESVCSSNDLSHAETASSNSGYNRRPFVTPVKAQSSGNLGGYSSSSNGTVLSSAPAPFTTTIRRTVSPTASRRWDKSTNPASAPTNATPLPVRATTPVRASHRSGVDDEDCLSKTINGVPLLHRSLPVGFDRVLVHAVATRPPSANSRMLLSQIVARWTNRYHENQQNYKEGGYMSINAGDMLRNRYMMLHKLGWGEFSTVWLAFDRDATEPQHTFVAVKVAKCHASVTESSKYENNLLTFVRANIRSKSPVTYLLDNFEHRGQYGNHFCMVMPLHGSNMLSIIDYMKARKRRRSDKEISMIKEITASTLQSLNDLEALNVIHTDLKPENVLCAAPDPKTLQIIQSFLNRNPGLVSAETQRLFEQGDPNHLVCLADFGLSVLLEPSTNNNEQVRAVGRKKEFLCTKAGQVTNVNGTMIQTREYRAPEILFGTDFCPRSDVWSVGCMVYEMITGDFLVDPKRKTRVEKEMDVEHLAMMIQIIGPVPSRITQLMRSPNPPRYLGNYFNEQGQFLYADRYRHYPRRSLAAELEVFLEPAEAERAAQFIMSCFTYDPMERCHPADLMRHSWLKSSS